MNRRLVIGAMLSAGLAAAGAQTEIGRRHAAEWAKLARPLEKENGL